MVTLATALVTAPVTIFLIVLVIILLAPVILNRLKIPHIIGMIAAGIVVGPYGLNILANDSSFAIFGQVGLLYLMFLAGLEIDMYHLRRNLRRGITFGLLTFLIPMAIGIIASVYILRLSWLTSTLLASMYASHTLIGYPVVARFGITKSPAVLISVVATIVAVVGALLVLAGAVNIHATGSPDLTSLLWLVGRLIAYCLAVLYIYPRLTRRFFKTYSDKVTQYVFIMVMMFFSAWVTGVIGLEPVLGAFFAGLVLNRYIPFNSPLMHSVEFVGNALFIPYFLISVGMMINLGVVTRSDTLLTASIMLAVAIIGKWIPAWAAQHIFKMQVPDRRLMFGLTTAHTAVALAVVTIGYNMLLPDGSRLMDETILNGTILVILVTCAIAPIVTARAAGNIKLRSIETDSTQPAGQLHAIESALIPVSNPITTAPLVELAMMMRRRREGLRHDRLYALHVRNENTRQAKAISEQSLSIAARTAAGADTPIELLERFDINTVTGIVNTIAERDISSIVMGMHVKSTIIDSFLGTKIEQLLMQSNSMVVILRCYIPLNTITRIVVFIPPKAEYETGFHKWVNALGNLAREIGCRIIFCSSSAQVSAVRSVIASQRLEIRYEFRVLNNSDALMMYSTRLLDDDLIVVIGARKNTLSYSSDMADTPQFLQRNFERNNLCLIYPEQSGTEPHQLTFSDPLGADIGTAASPLWTALRSRIGKLISLKKRYLTQRHRYQK